MNPTNVIESVKRPDAQDEKKERGTTFVKQGSNLSHLERGLCLEHSDFGGSLGETGRSDHRRENKFDFRFYNNRLPLCVVPVPFLITRAATLVAGFLTWGAGFVGFDVVLGQPGSLGAPAPHLRFGMPMLSSGSYDKFKSCSPATTFESILWGDDRSSLDLFFDSPISELIVLDADVSIFSLTARS
jgi:hypothetical protein